MALVVKDRVKQTTTTTGTGNIVLNGNVDGFQTFAAALADGDTTYFGIFVPSTNDYEVGLGTWTESSATLARTTILESSNSGSAINITAQAEVFITQPAEKAVFQDANGDVDLGSNKILFGNVYSGTNDLPSASTYHGMFAHVHGTGKAYYAHGGNWIELVNEDTSGNVSMGGNLTVTGDLTVNGTTTTVSTTNTVVKDSLIELGNGTSGSPSNDAGIVIERGSSDNAFIGYDESADKFTVGTGSFTGATTGNLTISTGTLVANVEGNVTGNVTGNVSGSSGSTTGNAATATTAGTVTTAAQTNITSLGTLTTLTVDDITINGSTISDGGDFTLDVGGEISIDSDSGVVRFKDDGTQYGLLAKSSNNFIIKSQVSDGDLIIRGNDGGSEVDAITFDMSDAGTATFNHDVKMGDLQYLLMGNGNDLELSSDGTNGKIAAANGNLNLDVAGEIYLDADSGIIRIRDAGGDIGMLRNESNDFTVRSMVGDADLLFKGNDGGSVITALTLDMSDAGSAYFNNDLYVPDQIIHSGDTDTYLQFSAANTFRVVAGDSERLNVNTGGVDVSNGNLNVTGNIAVSGTVDGIDIAGNINQAVKTTSSPQFANIYLDDKIMHTGDNDTYLGFATNQINLYCNGSQAAFLNDSGIFTGDGSVHEDYDALSGTSPTCNVNNGGAFSLTMSGNTTFTFSSGNSGYSEGFILQLTGNGSTVTWPGSVKWAGGTAPDAPANGETDILVFHTRDGGSNWYGVLASDAAA